MWYLFNNQKQCYGYCDSKPNIDDLAARGEFAIESTLTLSIQETGIDDNGNIFQLMPPPPNKEEIIIALDNEYSLQFAALTQALGLASLDNNTTLIGELQAEYAELKKEYQQERKAILNDC